MKIYLYRDNLALHDKYFTKLEDAQKLLQEVKDRILAPAKPGHSAGSKISIQKNTDRELSYFYDWQIGTSNKNLTRWYIEEIDVIEDASKVIGDPAGKSITKVLNDADYNFVNETTEDVSSETTLATIIVKHNKTKTYWQANYHVYDDYSDAATVSKWKQVIPEQVTVTKYKVKE